MIFSVLNPVKKFDTNSLYICSPHLYTVATLPWEIQKSHCQQYNPYIQIIYVISEENKLLRLYPPHLKHVTALPCKMHKFFMFFHFSRLSSTNPRYGRVAEASCCDMAEFQQSVVDDAVDQWRKNWKHVSMQKVVTLNICCNVACLIFHLPRITTGSSQSHQRLEKCNMSSVR